MPTRVPTGRFCACGEAITVTEKTAAFGATHGRDPKTWPARCAFCILDTTIAMFAAIGRPDVMPETLAPPAKTCDVMGCDLVLGGKFYSDAKYVVDDEWLRGDICLSCRAQLPSWVDEEEKKA